MYLTPQHILLAGATGLTGELLLDRLLNEPTVERVLAPSRKPLAHHPHLENPVGDPAVFLPQLSGPVDVAFCCLGTTIKQAGSEKAFRAVDHDMVVAFAKRARPSLLIGERLEERPAEKIAGLFSKLIPGKYHGIEACELARALWRLALEDQQGVRVIESDELRKLGK